MRVGRVVVAVVAWLAAAVMMAVPVVAANDRPTLQVTPTRPLELGTLSPGETRWGELVVLNQSPEASYVRLVVPASALEQRLPGKVVVTVARDDIVIWTGPVRRLAERPVLPGRLAAGEAWELDVRATAIAQRGGDLEVLGEQASRGGGNRDAGPALGAAEPVDASVSLSADALDPSGHTIPLRVQLVSYLLLVLGLLWLVVAFRRDAGTGRGRRPSADLGR